MSAHTLCVALTSEDAKGKGHFLEHPLSLFRIAGKVWDAGQTDALGDEFEGRFLLCDFVVSVGRFGFLVDGEGFGLVVLDC